MARPSFVKSSILVLTILCLSQLLAATEPRDGTFHAKVKFINRSNKKIQESSIYVTNKFSTISLKQLKFSAGLNGKGQQDDGNGAQIVDYELHGGNSRWFVTWVFEGSKSIQMSEPSSAGCFDNQINFLGPEIIRQVETTEPGASSCGLPPHCEPQPPNAVQGAAVATDFISKELLNQPNNCGFQMFGLTFQDSLQHSDENWVTITIQNNGKLLFQSATASQTFKYVTAEVTAEGVVTLEAPNSTTPRAVGSFGVEIPAISSVA